MGQCGEPLDCIRPGMNFTARDAPTRLCVARIEFREDTREIIDDALQLHLGSVH